MLSQSSLCRFRSIYPASGTALDNPRLCCSLRVGHHLWHTVSSSEGNLLTDRADRQRKRGLYMMINLGLLAIGFIINSEFPSCIMLTGSH
jgi:hypothetical protein